MADRRTIKGERMDREEGDRVIGSVGVGFDQAVDVVLSAVVRDRHLEHERDAQQRFVCIPVGDDLQYCKVLQN